MDNGPSLFYYKNTNLLVLTNARGTASGGGIINNASGDATIQVAGVPVVGGGPIPFTYIGGSQGRYEAIFPATLSIPPGTFLKILINLQVNANLVYRGILQAKVVENA